ncbi:uncharacterized protein LOC133731088 [Rosa rugosa]|uniref:uncharacterized protein LOC133731088 n=1 Tax=Rosa rugosa TaxID=74645 RepID=UPI002B40675D|nr:uncharacterized protein LOC133731088 [Rosa rugosa]
MRCVRTVSYSYIVNGDPQGHVIPSRGLRQGNSISPYFFLLCAEALSKMILTAEEGNVIHGVKICPSAPSISHFLFTDDAFIFFKAEIDECYALKEIFEQYERASGQLISYQKSSVSFSKNVKRDKQNDLAAILEVLRVDKHDKYLGLPTEQSYSKTEAFNFLNERIRKRTQGRQEKTLSAAGKEVMVKAVVQSIPTYVMSCFELPKHLCLEMHCLMARFWWGDKVDDKKIHWLAWEKLCVPKSEGGLGF